MSQNTSIEWTQATWSPLRVRVKPDAAKIAAEKGYTSLIQIAKKMAGHVGPHCEHVSPGCEECYSGTNNHRCLPKNGTGLPFDRRSRDLVEPFVDESILMQPLKWKQPVKVFPMNQTDMFGEWWSYDQIFSVLAVAAACPQHTFQILTKRPKRMWQISMMRGITIPIMDEMKRLNLQWKSPGWPLPNVWLGVSVENQIRADARIPLLLQTPAAKRFVSYEPALGPVDFTATTHQIGIGSFETSSVLEGNDGFGQAAPRAKLDWLIAGGESGPRARPAHPDWFRSARDQCVAAGVPFFFKQHGAWVSVSEVAGKGKHFHFPDGATVRRVGKKAAGASLDGREWKQFPEVQHGSL